MMIRVFAVTARGLEALSAAEMAHFPGVQVERVSYRRVSATTESGLSDLLSLRTVDDVFVELATWPEIIPQRAGLAQMTDLSSKLGFTTALTAIGSLRPIGLAPDFSVTVNFVGKRNYSTDEIKIAVADGVVMRNPWAYTSEDLSAINVRIFIEHDTAYVGVRLGAGALHSRAYKQAHISGSLKPNIGAAMLKLAEARAGMRVVDPLCGAGTIVIEAALAGEPALGGDNSREALAAAAANSLAAGVGQRCARWDARQLPLADGSIERVVTNLPWGRQVTVDDSMALFYGQVCAEIERVTAPSGQVVVLTSLPDLVRFERLRMLDVTEISLFGQTPVIMRFA